jgi:excisionase family DNA binding protein
VTARLLTAREVSEGLGVSAETVLRWTRRGELPAIRLPGGAIRYRADDLDDWLDGRRVGATRRGATSYPEGRAQTNAIRPVPSTRPATPPRDDAV